MIRKSLPAVKRATYCVMISEPKYQELVAPQGTGFFVSSDGWFVTALHVLTIGGGRHDPIRQDLDTIVLVHPGDETSGIQEVTKTELVHHDAQHDFALLKAEPQGGAKYSYVEIVKRDIAEGEPVYCFGYPLSDLCETRSKPAISSTYSLTFKDDRLLILKPKIVSGVVAAAPLSATCSGFPAVCSSYATDINFDFGISGAPIIATECGKAFAFATETESVSVPQDHLKALGRPRIGIPTRFGTGTSLASHLIVESLEKHGVALSDT